MLRSKRVFGRLRFDDEGREHNRYQKAGGRVRAPQGRG